MCPITTYQKKPRETFEWAPLIYNISATAITCKYVLRLIASERLRSITKTEILRFIVCLYIQTKRLQAGLKDNGKALAHHIILNLGSPIDETNTRIFKFEKILLPYS